MLAQDLLGGFVHRLGTVDDAMAWAQEMSQLAPLTIRAHKKALERLGGMEISMQEVEQARLAAWAIAEAAAGREEFLGKRPPKFPGP